MLQLVGVLYVRVSVCDDWNVRSSRTILIEIACDSNWNNEAIKFDEQRHRLCHQKSACRSSLP